MRPAVRFAAALAPLLGLAAALPAAAGEADVVAVEAVPEDAAESNAAIATLIEGVVMTERELHSIFERHGIKRIEADGQKFDHNLHQAMMEVPDSGQPAGTVVQVLQSGYTIHDRLLRPAMVGVAKGDGGNKNGGGANDGDKGSTVDTSA